MGSIFSNYNKDVFQEILKTNNHENILEYLKTHVFDRKDCISVIQLLLSTNSLKINNFTDYVTMDIKNIYLNYPHILLYYMYDVEIYNYMSNNKQSFCWMSFYTADKLNTILDSPIQKAKPDYDEFCKNILQIGIMYNYYNIVEKITKYLMSKNYDLSEYYPMLIEKSIGLIDIFTKYDKSYNLQKTLESYNLNNRVDQFEQPDQTVQSDKLESFEQPDQTDQIEQPEYSDLDLINIC